ncbi:MAG TPA: hypothetical protein DDW38_01870 [Psychrobacter sp.]|nr:hypothetical protein [Psychrobacter sp.]
MSLKIIIALVLIVLIAVLFFIIFRKENTARKSPSLPASNNPNSDLNTNLTQPQRHDNWVGSANMEENQSIEDAETIEKNIETLDPMNRPVIVGDLTF